MRRGITIAEVLVVVGLITALGVPLLGFIATDGHEVMSSGDYMLAEALLERHVHQMLAIPFGELAAKLPLTRKIAGVPEGDEELARKFPEYGIALSGPESFRGSVVATLAAPGLIQIEAALTWPVKPGSAARRHYSILRMRAQPDLAIRANYPFVDGAASPAGSPAPGDPGDAW
jgi:hypothetical protein